MILRILNKGYFVGADAYIGPFKPAESRLASHFGGGGMHPTQWMRDGEGLIRRIFKFSAFKFFSHHREPLRRVGSQGRKIRDSTLIYPPALLGV